MEEPFLYKGSEPIQWTFSQILDLCKLAIEHGAADKLVSEADAQGIRVTVPGEAINFTKRFLFKNRLHKVSDGLKAVVESAHCISVVRQPDPNPYKEFQNPDAGT